MRARVRGAVVIGAAVVACGRVGFDPMAPTADATTDAPHDAAQPIALVAMTGSAGSATGISLPTTPTTPGDLLVVAVTVWDATAVASVVDSSGGHLTRAVRAAMGNTSSELWYAAPITNAVTRIDVAMAGSATGYDAWVGEFANVADGAPTEMNQACLQYPPTIARAPVTTTAGGELVIATSMLAYPLFVDSVDAPFTALPFQSGNGTAYVVADAPGAYAPAWGVGSGSGMAAMTCSSTIAFRPR